MRLPIVVALSCIMFGWWYGCGEVSQHPPWNSKRPPSERPFATRDGTTIVLKPSGATFQVPQEWVERFRKFGNNIHLTHQQLDAVARGAREWHTEYASVCNAVLPFDRCAAHVGGGGWGRQSVSYIALQVRIYDLDEDLDEIEQAIKTRGAADVTRITKNAAALECSIKDSWRKCVFSYRRWYYDYGATAHVDFRFRRLGERTFVFVFMYTEVDQKTITAILDSFKVN
jgi:hypothetical protein